MTTRVCFSRIAREQSALFIPFPNEERANLTAMFFFFSWAVSFRLSFIDLLFTIIVILSFFSFS